MARVPGCEAVYEVADQWRERCLESDGSLLWPDLEEPTWTVENISIVETRLGQASQGNRSGWELLIQAIRNDAPDISRLVSDLIAIWSMTSWVPVERKQIWLRPFLEDAATKGAPEPQLGPVTTGFQQANSTDLYLGDDPTRRNPQMSVYLMFAKEVKLANFDLDEIQAIHDLLYRLSRSVAFGINSAASILHRLFPDTYEPLSHTDKRMIVQALGKAPKDLRNIDEEVQRIRDDLTETTGRQDFLFTDNDVKTLWKPTSSQSANDPHHFADDTPGFVEWMRMNPDGFVLNTRRNIAANDLMLHRAGCSHVGMDDQVNLTGRYTKVCSVDAAALFDWARREVGSHADIRLCSTCRPDDSPTIRSESAQTTRASASKIELANASHIPLESISVLVDLLRTKRQIIFEGPPGSGKTFTAKYFARYLARLPLDGPPDPQVEIVQFHQSYGYEDFVAGIRPSTTPAGTIRYDVQPGIFIEMCKRAEANPERNFVLIIDEINRGNLSRIFGELLYALEYRDEPVRLQYPDLLGDVDADHLVIPKNLYLIGTMNSTDRSLAMIDYALRRRFYFWKLMPVVDGQAPVLEGWMRSKGIGKEVISDVTSRFVEINAMVSSLLTPDYAIGHSYFMDESIGESTTRLRIWKYALQPLLEEYFHSQRNRDQAIDQLRHLMLDA